MENILIDLFATYYYNKIILNTDESNTVPTPPPQIYTIKNNNIHTISTKCQYHAANKKPK